MSLRVPVQAKLLAGEAILLQRTSRVIHILIDIQCAIRAVCCTVGLLLCSCVAVYNVLAELFTVISLEQCTSRAVCIFTSRAVSLR
jgi:hypothetical protein